MGSCLIQMFLRSCCKMSMLFILALIYFKDCQAFVCSCNNASDCLEKCVVKENDLGEKNTPNLVCREENKLVVSWEASEKNGTEYLIEYRPQASIKWRNLTMQIKKMADKNMVFITNVTGGYIFRIRTYYDGKPTGAMMESGVFYTLPENASTCKIKNAWITDFIPLGRHLATTINWEPVQELVCGYQIVIWAIERQEVDELSPNVRINITFSITYNTFSIKIINYDSLTETELCKGEYYQINFKTPSCNEMNNYDYNICEPEKPLNLSASFDDCMAILYWKAPYKFPDSYLVTVIMLTNGAQINSTVPRESTTAYVDASTLSKTFEIHLRGIANNKAGPAAIIKLKNQCKIFTNDNKTEEKNKETVEEKTESEKWTIIITMMFLTIIILASLVLISCQVCSQYRNHLERHIQSATKIEEKSDGVKNIKETKEKYIGYDITSSMITLKEVIGKGEFGIVFKALMKKQKQVTEVAVKTLRHNATKEDIVSFQEEVEVMRTVGKHENLVSLIGYCPNEKLLVVEYCALGDLQNFLREARKTKLLIQELINNGNAEINKFQPIDNIVSNMIYERTDIEQKHLKLNITDLLYLARQVATGMEYLTNNKIIHRDLATRNILLTFDLVAKISDFGLSRDIYEESVYRKKRVSKLPIKWMAIESLSHHIFTSQSDVWSFGILLWEVMTFGGAPYPSIPSAQVYKLLKTGYRMEKPPSCNSQVYEIMTMCWKEKPYNRPSFSQIIAKLDNIINKGDVQNYTSFDTNSLNYAHIGSPEE